MLEDSLGVDGAEEDVVSFFLRNEDKEILPGVKGIQPAFGQCFPSLETADAHVRRYGARNMPYRKKDGGGAATHTYVCKHASSSAFAKRPPQRKKGAAGASATVSNRGGLQKGIGGDVLKSQIVQEVCDGRKAGKCCGLVQIQRTSVESLVRGSYCKTALSKWLHLLGGKERKKQLSRSGGMYHKYPQLQEVPKGFSSKDLVYAVTEFIPHTCLGECKPCDEGGMAAGNLDADQGGEKDDEDHDDEDEDEEVEDKEDEGEENDDEGEENDDEEPDKVESSTIQNRSDSVTASVGRSLTSDQLASALRPDFEYEDCSWTLRETRAKVKKIDPGAVGIAAAVLRRLKNDHQLEPDVEMELIQGLSVVLEERGFGVMLHTARAADLREQVEHPQPFLR